ncbi:hypothetical protein GGP41_008479 [Bipolaris sorokiniana]|uniref:Uncharacterized protein n=1 Tax=Cochliobolus sativus TaxID=45130 RepID=A0A8H5Z991_COCSA|nr:hypothetical protein GGP41_008479 [Bipolaris sorokiniana]
MYSIFMSYLIQCWRFLLRGTLALTTAFYLHFIYPSFLFFRALRSGVLKILVTHYFGLSKDYRPSRSANLRLVVMLS